MQLLIRVGIQVKPYQKKGPQILPAMISFFGNYNNIVFCTWQDHIQMVLISCLKVLKDISVALLA